MKATNLEREPALRLQQLRERQHADLVRRIRDVAAGVVDQMGALDTRSERERTLDALASAVADVIDATDHT